MDLSGVTHSFPSMSYVQQPQEPANTASPVYQQAGPAKLSLISDEAKNTLALAQNLGVEDLDFNPAELNKLNNLLNAANKLMEVSRDTPLSTDQSTQLEAIDIQIEQLFEAKIPDFSESELIKAEEQINQQLDEIFGYNNSLSENQQNQVNQLIEEIDSLYTSSNLSIEQEDQLNGLFMQVDQIYGVKSYEELTDQQQQKVDGLWKQLSTLEPELTP